MPELEKSSRWRVSEPLGFLVGDSITSVSFAQLQFCSFEIQFFRDTTVVSWSVNEKGPKNN